jgi:predicted nucleic acid-binding protein
MGRRIEQVAAHRCLIGSADNYLLAMATAAEADFLVTGDAKGLLRLKKFGSTRILAPGSFLKLLRT